MNFDFDDDQAALREFGLELAGRTEDAYWQEVDLEYRFPKEFWDQLAEAGMLGIALPEEFGGGGKGLLELAIAVEGVAEGGGGMEAGSLFLAGPVFGGCLLERHGTQAQKEAYLPGLASGQMCAGAFTEPESGSNITAIKTRAELRGDRYVINGQKVYISLVQQSQRIVVMARTQPYDPEHRTRGISLLLGELPSDAVRTAPFKKLGNHFMDTNRVYFSDYEVPAENVVGEEGNAWGPLYDVLNPERIILGAAAVGDREPLHPARRRVREGAEPVGQADRRVSEPPVPARPGADPPGERAAQGLPGGVALRPGPRRRDPGGHGQVRRRPRRARRRGLGDPGARRRGVRRRLGHRAPLAEPPPLPDEPRLRRDDAELPRAAGSRAAALVLTAVPETMTALRVQALGEGARPERVPVPRPGEGEALVRMSEPRWWGTTTSASSRGRSRTRPRRSPPGSRALASSRRSATVSTRERRRFGTPVRLVTRGHADGTWAEYVVVPGRALVPVPEGLDPAVAAACGTVSAAAWAALERAGPRGGREPSASPARRARWDRSCCSLRARRGATRVVAWTRSPADLPAGVEVAEDEGPAEPVDALVDTVGGDLLPRRLRSVRPGGRAVLVG